MTAKKEMVMGASTENPAEIRDGGAMERVRVPAWEVKYKLDRNPDELAHFVCCRDLDWRKAICGYEEPEAVILANPTTFCTMCVEVIQAHGGVPGSGKCPFDDQPCPDDETVDRTIDERTSRL
jgi:hypothetical protein